jgi:hypothetical protein
MVDGSKHHKICMLFVWQEVQFIHPSGQMVVLFLPHLSNP